jgi:hypothetical protein
MANREAPNGIVLWHYPFSPFARRMVWYLQLRGLEYAECVCCARELNSSFESYDQSNRR